MNRVLNFGSINVDHVYAVDHFVRPGETIRCLDYRRFAGGKGLNQAIALAQAGASVFLAGKINAGDAWLKTLLEEKGVDTRFVDAVDEPTGHALIQVNRAGENSIVIYGGANRLIGDSEIARALAEFGTGDWLLLQNEINAVPQIMQAAKAKGLRIAINPAPMTAEVLGYPLDLVDLLIVNETEANGLSGETDPESIYRTLQLRYPHADVLLTLGGEGARYFSAKGQLDQPAEKVKVVDTTGAGDTFIGFFLARLIDTEDPKTALAYASRAAGICVSRHGAAESIPSKQELEEVSIK